MFSSASPLHVTELEHYKHTLGDSHKRISKSLHCYKAYSCHNMQCKLAFLGFVFNIYDGINAVFH